MYTKATQQILDKYGETYTWEVKMSLMGLSHMEMCERIVEIYDLPITPEEYSKLQREINSKIMSSAQLLPGNFTKIIQQLIAFFYFSPSLCYVFVRFFVSAHRY